MKEPSLVINQQNDQKTYTCKNLFDFLSLNENVLTARVVTDNMFLK